MLNDLLANRQRKGDVAWIAMLIVVAVAGLSTLFSNATVCGLVMAGVLGLALYRWHTPQDVLLCVAGIVLGPTMELFATSTGLWHYPWPSVGALPFWVFALWPVYPLCLVRLTHALMPPDGKRPRALTDLTMGLAIVALEIPVLCGLGTEHPAVATALTVVMLVPSIALIRTRQTGLMLFISGVVGPVMESLPVQLGAWSYPSPLALGLPMWLPTGYALFGFALVRVAFALELLLQRETSAQPSPLATPS
jgi:uncharacterized membrane protein YoaT (DUF817 family)